MAMIAAFGLRCGRMRDLAAFLFAVVSLSATMAAGGEAPAPADASEPLFWIGKPDGSGMELGSARTNPEESYPRDFPRPIQYTVGKDQPSAWPFIHPSTMDGWAGGKTHTYSIHFQAGQSLKDRQNLIVGLATFHPSPSILTVTLNDADIASQRLPAGVDVDNPAQQGPTASLTFPIPADTIRPGQNSLSLTLSNGSWIVYDYLYLGPSSTPPQLVQPGDSLLARFRAGPMAGVDDVIFCARKANEADWHWYANIGYYADDADRKAWREGAKLYRWNAAMGKLSTLLADPRGGIRDPQIHYDGKKILFSYRKGGTENYLLYEINIDGTGLRQLTDGAYDDIEPTYLPDGDIVFVSSRAKRWVNCWFTQVAVLHRCDADGRNIRALSSNNEQDNTPWPLPDGRILYTRWEYVDRSQVDYHHLWTANPDGTAQMVWYGNLHPGTVMIDAKPIPGSDKIVASFSPGHGQREHAGAITVVDPKAGPDAPASARSVSRGSQFRDPWAFSEDCFMAALGPTLVVLDGSGLQREIFKLPAADLESNLRLHEPRPLVAHSREGLVPNRIDPHAASGRLVLADIYHGRNLDGIPRGQIKKLLVLETLPIPVHYSGSMEPISYGGTFTLVRILGTIPVEPDGSAYMEVPALRSLFFVALDEQDLAVKRMQSFLTVQPGETTGCVGCHEQRTQSARKLNDTVVSMAMRRAPSAIQAIAHVPEVLDFPRDIQPILDQLCVSCHGYEKTTVGGPRAGRVILTGDRGPIYSHSYYATTMANLFSDGRNQPRSNYAPRRLGSASSRILSLLDGSHYGVKADAHQRTMLRLWIETGAAYPGTYAALGSGMIGGYLEEQQIDTDSDWPAAQAAAGVIARRCLSCHDSRSRRLPRNLSDELGVTLWQSDLMERSPSNSRHLVFNLSRPEKSLVLLAPLMEAAGGFGLCRDPATRQPATVFAGTSDPDYQKLLALCAAGKARLDQIKRFDMAEFRPAKEWVREMKRYGLLPAVARPAEPIDVYATEQHYWRSLWHAPQP
jgi:hypothetical protein